MTHIECLNIANIVGVIWHGRALNNTATLSVSFESREIGDS
ncbi:hypothetical protein APHMUC_0519 [Anaplasma phagocytophilum str. ApMUC09]|uniref:Uncharacterized protein n=1 Tax=Anaplasma phagocytophilum str. ApMUC09 TaxID=1359152 RepID=A0A0F3N8C5_ANAPH|nr:hypothetical protein APHMUC_0519 [Anaplasma phagocytophilum str. ApMUC09]